MGKASKKAENVALVIEFLERIEDTEDLEESEQFGEFLRRKVEAYGEDWVFDNDDLLVEEFRSKLP